MHEQNKCDHQFRIKQIKKHIKSVWYMLLPEWISIEILKMCHMHHTVFISLSAGCLYLLHFLKSLCFRCFVLFYFILILSSSGCLVCCWYCVCMFYSAFYPPIGAIMPQISNCTHFIQMNLCVWVCTCGENLMHIHHTLKHVYVYISICKLYCICICSVCTLHVHMETEWSSSMKVVLFCYFSVRLSFDCCVWEFLCFRKLSTIYIWSLLNERQKNESRKKRRKENTLRLNFACRSMHSIICLHKIAPNFNPFLSVAIHFMSIRIYFFVISILFKFFWFCFA